MNVQPQYDPTTLAHRLAIQDCIHRNALGNDLLDVELWKSTYWPDAYEEHAWYRGNAHVFVEQTAQSLRTEMDTTWHQVGNVVIEVDGDIAKAISYFYAYCRLVLPDGARSDLFSGGRNVDRFERRSGEWKIAHRINKADWVRFAEGSFPWGSEVIKGYAPRLGCRDSDDPARAFLSSSGVLR